MDEASDPAGLMPVGGARGRECLLALVTGDTTMLALRVGRNSAGTRDTELPQLNRVVIPDVAAAGARRNCQKEPNVSTPPALIIPRPPVASGRPVQRRPQIKPCSSHSGASP